MRLYTTQGIKCEAHRDFDRLFSIIRLNVYWDLDEMNEELVFMGDYYYILMMKKCMEHRDFQRHY